MPKSNLVTELRKRLERLAGDSTRIAVRSEAKHSYSDLLERIEFWQQRLGDHQRVAFQLPNSFDWAALDLALLFSGRVSVPVPEFFTTAQVDHLVTASGADLLVNSDASAGSRLIPGSKPVWYLRELSAPAVKLHPDTAKVTFTSGSTGTPKGVCLSAQSLVQTAQSLSALLAPEKITRHLSVLPLSLLLENVAGLYANLWNGSEITLLGLSELGLGGSSSMDPMKFADAQMTHRPHSLILVPEQLLALVALSEAGVELPASYRFIAVGGARVAPDLLDRAHVQGLPAYEGYGLTECGSVVALNTPQASQTGLAGQLLPHVELSIIEGEAVISTPRMLGYVGDHTQNGPVYTGDCAELLTADRVTDAQDFLRLHGRLDNRMITSFGRNLSPEWLESELQAELPIALACVFGDQLPANVALLVARDNFSVDEVSSAIASCNSRLPDYAQITHHITLPRADLVAAGAISPLGKLRRAIIREAFGKQIDRMTSLVCREHNESQNSLLEATR